jgi:hypothetical protein
VKKKSVKKAAAPAQSKKVRRVSVSSVAEGLLLAGKSNAEVWTALKAKFRLDDKKRHYPTWYRCRLQRMGKLKAAA